MVKLPKRVMIFSLFLGVVSAGEVHAQNPNEVFIGTYGVTIAYDRYSVDDEAYGLQLGYSRDINQNFGFRGSFYSLEHDDVAGLDVTGLDLALVGGMLGDGFNLFGGAGLFSETWENASGAEEDFSGLQLVGGIGYSWEQVGLDLVVGIRDSSDYESYVNSVHGTNVNTTATSSSLNIGYRF